MATVLCHPEIDRVGERYEAPWRAGLSVALSRDTPAFGRGAGDAAARPLGDRGVSRKPLALWMTPDGLRFEPVGEPPYHLDRAALRPGATASLAALERGVVLRCGGRVLLSLEARAAAATEAAHPALARAIEGGSAAMQRVRARVALLAPHRVPVTVVGEPDSGRGRVARALHRVGARPDGPWVHVTAESLPKEAPSDAVDALFERARGGTLCLDGVERLSEPAQWALLRAVDAGEHDPAAAWVVAVTAADLAHAAEMRRFVAPLAFRLCTTVVDMPPLRARALDVPALFVEALRTHGAPLDTPGWLTAPLVEALMLHGWPGNLRELDNLALEVVIATGDAPEARLPLWWGPRPRGTAPVDALAPVSEVPGAAIDTRAWAVAPEALRAALRRHGWRVRPVAAELEISRNTIYAMMGRLGIRRPSDLSAADIRAAVEVVGPSLARVAAHLEVSARGLKLRLGALGLTLE